MALIIPYFSPVLPGVFAYQVDYLPLRVHILSWLRILLQKFFLDKLLEDIIADHFDINSKLNSFLYEVRL